MPGFMQSASKNFQYPALSKCFVAVGNIEGIVGSKHQVPLPARGLIVKFIVEY